MNIDDAVVLVTGANRGLGRALVLASLEAGAKRIYAGARDPKQLEPLVRFAPERIVPLAIDVTDERSLDAAAARARDVTVLVNNAGVLASFGVLASSPDAIAQDFKTNVFGMLAATKAFLPALEAAAARAGENDDGAALVNVLSVASLASFPSLGGYSAAKAAAFSMTQALRAELTPKRIRVHGVLAGPIDTDMVRTFTMPKTSPEVVARAILEGIERGVEDIAPDPTARDILATWARDPKALERQLATPT